MKKKNSFMKDDEVTKLTLGKGYWNGFWKCTGYWLEWK